MGVFDPNADASSGAFKPCREHLRIVKADVKKCGTGRDAINFEFKTDAGKTRFKSVTVNSIFSSVIKGMMIGVGIDFTQFGSASLYDIANAFRNTDGDAWTTIPKDREYPEPQYFFPKESGSVQSARAYQSDEPPLSTYENSTPPDFPDDIPFN